MSWLSCAVGDGSEKLPLYFFLSSRNVGQFFAVFKCTCCFVPVSNNQMKTKTNVATFITQLRSGAFEWCMISLLYVNSFLLSSELILHCSSV